MNEDDVRKAVLSFPAGSAGGPDSLGTQHLRDMVLRKEAGPELITALTGFINLVLAGVTIWNRPPQYIAPRRNRFAGRRNMGQYRFAGPYEKSPLLTK